MVGYIALTVVSVLLIIIVIYLHAIKRVLENLWEKLDAIHVALAQLPGRMKGWTEKDFESLHHPYSDQNK
jgi:uncharacterized protein YoxC